MHYDCGHTNWSKSILIAQWVSCYTMSMFQWFPMFYGSMVLRSIFRVQFNFGFHLTLFLRSIPLYVCGCVWIFSFSFVESFIKCEFEYITIMWSVRIYSIQQQKWNSLRFQHSFSFFDVFSLVYCRMVNVSIEILHALKLLNVSWAHTARHSRALHSIA